MKLTIRKGQMSDPVTSTLYLMFWNNILEILGVDNTTNRQTIHINNAIDMRVFNIAPNGLYCGDNVVVALSKSHEGIISQIGVLFDVGITVDLLKQLKVFLSSIEIDGANTVVSLHLKVIQLLPNDSIYIKCQHTASTSFISRLREVNSTDFTGIHIPIRMYMRALGIKRVENIYSCCVLRDPAAFALTYIAWNHVNRNPEEIPSSSSEWIDLITEDIVTIREQYMWFIIDHNGNVVVKEIFPFTYLQVATDIMLENMGYSSSSLLPHVNRITELDIFDGLDRKTIFQAIKPLLTKEYELYNKVLNDFEETYTDRIPKDVVLLI